MGEILADVAINTATIRIYKANIVNWNLVIEFRDIDTSELIIDTTYSIDTVKEQDIDGAFSIRVLPGIYDILIDRPGTLDYIIREVIVEKDDLTNVGIKQLLSGDIDKNGRVEIKDLNEIKRQLDEIITEYSNFGYPTQNYDFDENKRINITDMNFVKRNLDERYKVETYSK